MTSHFHFGHGLTGYGPEEPSICLSLTCLAECVSDALGGIIDGWGDQAYGERQNLASLRALRPSNGDDPSGYPGSWESIADAAIRALECQDAAEEADMLRMNLRAERKEAPLYRQNPAAWQAELRRLLLDSGNYPLTIDMTGYHRFYVSECSAWMCLLNEHDQGYSLPAACVESGGVIPCACRDCMDVVYWSPGSGVPPYCGDCDHEGCLGRLGPECDVEPTE